MKGTTPDRVSQSHSSTFVLGAQVMFEPAATTTPLQGEEGRASVFPVKIEIHSHFLAASHHFFKTKAIPWKNMTEAMSMVKFSSYVFRVFMMTIRDKQQKKIRQCPNTRVLQSGCKRTQIARKAMTLL